MDSEIIYRIYDKVNQEYVGRMDDNSCCSANVVIDGDGEFDVVAQHECDEFKPENYIKEFGYKYKGESFYEGDMVRYTSTINGDEENSWESISVIKFKDGAFNTVPLDFTCVKCSYSYSIKDMKVIGNIHFDYSEIAVMSRENYAKTHKGRLKKYKCSVCGEPMWRDVTNISKPMSNIPRTCSPDCYAKKHIKENTMHHIFTQRS